MEEDLYDYTLSYPGRQIDQLLGKIDDLEEMSPEEIDEIMRL